MAPCESEVTASGDDVLVDTTMEDAQINLNELGSTSSNLEGKVQVDQNPRTSTTKKNHHSFDVLKNKSDKFQAILQLLYLVATLENRSKGKHRNKIHDITGTRKAFDYVDAITNLMVRDNEIVAAVAFGDPIPTTGIITVNLPSEKLNAQPRSAPMDTGLSPDFYEESAGSESFLQVATVANSKFYSKDFERGSNEDFKPLSSSDPNTLGLWDKLKETKEEDVALWALDSNITLEGHMRIIESYLNEFKQSNSSREDRHIISNKMSKYIIGSCWTKMYRRAFYWTSLSMIGFLTWTGSMDKKFPDINIATNPDHRLAEHLAIDMKDSHNQNFGQLWMTYHPSKSVAPNYLDGFMDLASGTSQYMFNRKIATIFLDLLLSSLYAYLCILKRLKDFIKANNKGEIRKQIGQFSNAIRTLYVLSHSNAMKTYFTHAELSPLSHQDEMHGLDVDRAMKAIYKKRGWGTVEIAQGANAGEDVNGEAEENQDLQVFGNLESEVGMLYRRSFMSFVDHIAGLRLLERRSINLPSDELIKLSLIAVNRPPKQGQRYLPWEEMEKVIVETCKFEFGILKPVQVKGEDVINKIKAHLDSIEGCRGVIDSFKILLKNVTVEKKLLNTQYPLFEGCIHCESSLAAILCGLHGTRDDSDLHKLFQISNVDGKGHYQYNISVSKFCCPVCWELINVLNETYSNIKFVVRAHHSNLYPVCLPPWLPDHVLDKMIDRFKERLYDVFCRLPDPDRLQPFVPGHKNKNPSLESAGESVSSVGSNDSEQIVKDQHLSHE